MNDKAKARRLRDRRFKKELRRKEFHDSNIKNYHQKQALFNALFNNKPIEYIKRPAPKIFSLLTNREETVGYFNRILGMINNGTYTEMDFSKISYSDLPTICALSSLMVDHRTPGRFLQVTIPGANRPERQIWEDSQFANMIIREHELNSGSGAFLSRSSNKVNKSRIEEVLTATVDFFGKEKRSELSELAPAIIELAENTVYHADLKNTASLNWLINTRTIEQDGQKVKEFCLVDLGVGVFDSIQANVQRWNSTKYKVLHRLSEILEGEQLQSEFLARHIPTGIGSATNQTSRGKGVRHVYKIAQDPIFKAFDIITNKAHVNLKDIKSVGPDSKHNFFGTIYYWRIGFND